MAALPLSLDSAVIAQVRQGVARQADGEPWIICPDDHLHRPDGTYEWTEARFATAIQRSLAELDAALRLPHVKRAVFVAGLPASGKSTWVAAQPHQGTVYFDEAQLLTAKDRAPLVEIARRHRKPISVVHMRTPLAICLERNRQRHSHRQVPEAVLRDFHRQLQITPPTRREGFSRVIDVVGV